MAEVSDPHLYMRLVLTSYVTYPLQSTLNPILYSLVDREWRKGFVNVFTSVRDKLASTSSNTSNVTV